MSDTNAVPVQELQNNMAAQRRSGLIQDLGLFLYLLSTIGAALVIAFGPESRRTEYVILFAVMAAASLLAAYRFQALAVGLTGLLLLTFTVYTLFLSFAQGVAIVPMDYAWIPLSLLSLAGMLLFAHEMRRIEQTNTLLKKQMESVVLLDSLTGLYNQRALYIDLQRQMAFCYRNLNPISLMVVRLRYADELHSLLRSNQFSKLVQHLGEVLSESVRIEDRCYIVDAEAGEFAVILTCGKDDSALVRKRIETACSQKDAFSGIVDNSIRVDLRIACAEYEEGIANAIEFKHKVDSELQYDV